MIEYMNILCLFFSCKSLRDKNTPLMVNGDGNALKGTIAHYAPTVW